MLQPPFFLKLYQKNDYWVQTRYIIEIGTSWCLKNNIKHFIVEIPGFCYVVRSMIKIILYSSREFKVELQNCISLFQMLLCKFIYFFIRQFHFLANFFVHSLRFAINFSIHTQSVLIWKYFLDFFENQKTSLHNA